VSSAAPRPAGPAGSSEPHGPAGRAIPPTPRRRRLRLPLWLLALVAVGWTVLWCGVAWTAWEDARADRNLTDHGTAVTTVVVQAPEGGEIKLGYCRQELVVTAPGHGMLTVPAVRWCAQPVTAGSQLPVVVDPKDPSRGVPADAVQPAESTHLAPIVVAAVAALLAGFPLGRLLSAAERRRDAHWFAALGDR